MPSDAKLSCASILYPSESENIMGMGSAIHDINAISWQNTVAQLIWGTKELPAGWGVFMGP
jgi:hypothetical protein